MVTKKDNIVIYRRKKKEKKLILDLLLKYPIVQLACEKAGISRATFYRWKNEDEEFNIESEKAIFDWKQLINDMAEINVITWIKNGDKTLTMYWLNNNNPNYSNRPINQNIVIQTTNTEKKQIKDILEKLNTENENIN